MPSFYKSFGFLNFPPSMTLYTDDVHVVVWDVTSHKSVIANISEDLQSSFSRKKKMEQEVPLKNI